MPTLPNGLLPFAREGELQLWEERDGNDGE